MIGSGDGLWFPRPAAGGRSIEVSLVGVVPGGVDPDELPVAGELHRPGDQGHLDRPSRPGPAGPVHDAGEGHRAVGVGDPEHGRPGARPAGSPLGDRLPIGPGIVPAAPLRVGGDQHPGVSLPVGQSG